MKVDPSIQARLLDLQAVDTAIAQLKHQMKTLPELELIAGSKSKWSAVSEDFVRADTTYSDISATVKRAEADLIPVRERLARDQKLVDEGSVDAKSLKALVDEIEHLKTRITTLEDAQLEAEEALESAAAARDRAAEERKDLHGAIKKLMDSRDQKIQDLEAQIKAKLAERAQVAATIVPGLLSAYEKTAVRLGTGAAKLDGHRCTGCGLEANSADMARYEAAAIDDVIRCEECGRILVRR
ncbi:MAG: zinc ribbon domain-containing protein [Propionibacteriaceae bacterium]